MLFLNGKNDRPLIYVSENERFIIISGKSLLIDAIAYYKPIIEYIKRKKMTNVEVNIDLEYFSTSSSKSLLEIFKSVESTNSKVNWYFADTDIYEAGKDFEDMVAIKFNYIAK